MNTMPPSATTSPHVPFVILIAAAAAMGGFLFGFDTAVINGAVIALQKTFHAGSWEIGLSVSLALLGSAAGAFFAGAIADRHGRATSMVVAAALFLLSAVGSGIPFSLWDFIFWRALGGFAVGVASVIAPAYIAEVSPAHLRGRLGSLQQLAIVVGIFVALLNNYFLAGAAGSAEALLWFGLEAWRWMFWSAIPAAALYGIGALLIPESPRYLVATGRENEARGVLEKIVGNAAQAKVREIHLTVQRGTTPGVFALRHGWGLLPIVWLGIGLSVFQQFVGINVIFYYGSTLWRVVGFSEQHALWATVVTGGTNIATTLVAMVCVDRFGRKPLLLLGSAGMVATLGTLAFIFGSTALDAAGRPVLDESAGMAALVAANLYVFCFGFSWGPVVWVMLGEMFNNRIRATALAVAAAAQWMANFLVSTTFPPLIASLGLEVAYGAYTAAAALSFFFVFFLIQETKGRELEDVE
jgi:MFS transporter, SP family, sugar:H+ symporter